MFAVPSSRCWTNVVDWQLAVTRGTAVVTGGRFRTTVSGGVLRPGQASPWPVSPGWKKPLFALDEIEDFELMPWFPFTASRPRPDERSGRQRTSLSILPGNQQGWTDRIVPQFGAGHGTAAGQSKTGSVAARDRLPGTLDATVLEYWHRPRPCQAKKQKGLFQRYSRIRVGTRQHCGASAKFSLSPFSLSPVILFSPNRDQGGMNLRSAFQTHGEPSRRRGPGAGKAFTGQGGFRTIGTQSIGNESCPLPMDSEENRKSRATAGDFVRNPCWPEKQVTTTGRN